MTRAGVSTPDGVRDLNSLGGTSVQVAPTCGLRNMAPEGCIALRCVPQPLMIWTGGLWDKYDEFGGTIEGYDRENTYDHLMLVDPRTYDYWAADLDHIHLGERPERHLQERAARI